jgi:hypothetical protein
MSAAGESAHWRGLLSCRAQAPSCTSWGNQIARLRNAYDNVQRVARGEPPLWVVPELSDLVM